MDLVRHAARGRARSSWRSRRAATVLALYGIWQFLHGGDDLENRIRGTLSHYMTFSGPGADRRLPPARLRARGRAGAGARSGFSCAVPLHRGPADLHARRVRGHRGGAPRLRRRCGGRAACSGSRRCSSSSSSLAPAGIRGPHPLDRPTSPTRPTATASRWRARARGWWRDIPVFGLGPDMVKPLLPALPRPGRARAGACRTCTTTSSRSRRPTGSSRRPRTWRSWRSFLARAASLLRRRGDGPERAALWAGALLAGSALTVAGLFEYNFGDTEVEMATLLVFAVPFSGRARTRGGD